MKGFHLVVLLTAGPGIKDTQVFCFNHISSSNKQAPLTLNVFF